jgi:hypothetical protein
VTLDLNTEEMDVSPYPANCMAQSVFWKVLSTCNRYMSNFKAGNTTYFSVQNIVDKCGGKGLKY